MLREYKVTYKQWIVSWMWLVRLNRCVRRLSNWRLIMLIGLLRCWHTRTLTLRICWVIRFLTVYSVHTNNTNAISPSNMIWCRLYLRIPKDTFHWLINWRRYLSRIDGRSGNVWHCSWWRLLIHVWSWNPSRWLTWFYWGWKCMSQIRGLGSYLTIHNMHNSWIKYCHSIGLVNRK